MKLDTFRTITPGGHRRYKLSRIEKEVLATECPDIKRKTIAYARVSSYDQKLDLKRQEMRLEEHCIKEGWDCEVISDLGFCLNYNKKGLKKLIRLICTQQV